MDAEHRLSIKNDAKIVFNQTFHHAPDTAYRAIAPSLHIPKFDLLFCLQNFLRGHCSCPSLPTPQYLLGQNEFKLIELYNYPSPLASLYFPHVHKFIFFIVHKFALQLFSLLINYPRLPIIILFSFIFLSRLVTDL